MHPFPSTRVDAELRFDATLRHAACLAFPSPSSDCANGTEQCWYFGRDLLNEGRHSPTGDGDVKIRPGPAGEVLIILQEPGVSGGGQRPAGLHDRLPRGLVHTGARRGGGRSPRHRHFSPAAAPTTDHITRCLPRAWRRRSPRRRVSQVQPWIPLGFDPDRADTGGEPGDDGSRGLRPGGAPPPSATRRRPPSGPVRSNLASDRMSQTRAAGDCRRFGEPLRAGRDDPA
ncbi:SsgA family sporulation/cell division regulator [Kitasatospora aburaviensis]